jgi:uncharacterized protein
MVSEVIQMPRQDGHTFKVGDGLVCDLSTLVDTRLLVQANSGGGKSWCLRRILEQTHGKVQHLVIDPEGEFASLRERFDYVYASRQGGDTTADPRSAKLLAERLLELGVSAILDIYELKAHERIKFVRFFLEALVDAPKSLWHPAIVVVDEAHVYCPQQGEAESAGPVIDLATRGRKRGFCAVLATQRLSKLHKDAAAECNNKMIGRSALDVDMARASDELGFRGKDQQQRLRELGQGEFFAFGPALSRAVSFVKVGTVQTEHPKAGGRLAFSAPPPTAKVRALLPKLADLPAEAEARQKSVDELRAEVTSLKRELTLAKKAQPEAKIERIEVVTAEDRKLLEQTVSRLLAAQRTFVDGVKSSLDRACENAARELQGVERLRDRVAAVAPIVPVVRASKPTVSRPVARPASPPSGDLTGPERRILDAIAWLVSIGNEEPEQTAVAFLANYTIGAGSFNNPRGSLRQKGLVEYLPMNRIRLTEEGAALANAPDGPLTTEELHERVLARLPGPEQRVLRPLLEAYPDAMTNEALAEAANYQVGAGSFNNPRGRLRSLGLVDYPSPGKVIAKSLLFLE